MIGEGISKQRITKFGSAMVFGASSPRGGLRLKLVHGPIDGGQRLLRTWELDTLPGRDEFQEIVDDIDHEAGDDATQMGWGVQRYFLVAESREGAMLGSLTLRYSANPQLGELVKFADSEPATPNGQVAQAMRNTEAAYRMLSGGVGMILESLNRRLGQQDQLIDKMLANQEKWIQMSGEASDKRFEREVWADTKRQEAEIKLRKEINDIDRKDMLTKLAVERLAPLLPAVIASITGRSAPPTPTTPRDEMMAALLDSLSQDQFARLGTVFSPEQMACFGMFVDALKLAKDGRPIVTPPPGASSPNRKPSEETAEVSVARIQRDILPWVIEKMRGGTIPNLPVELAEPVQIFRLFVRALTKDQYVDVVTKDGPFTPEERVAFAKLAELLHLAPEGVPVPKVAAPKPVIIGGVSLKEALAKGMTMFPGGIMPKMPGGLGTNEPKKP